MLDSIVSQGYVKTRMLGDKEVVVCDEVQAREPDLSKLPPVKPPLPSAVCRSCRPHRTCLSHTRIPFDGTAWLSDEQIRHARNVGCRIFLFLVRGRPLTDFSGRRLTRTKGMTFDALPLSYLDWLVGQDWIYGPFAQRLRAYLSRPSIDRLTDPLRREEPESEPWCSTEERTYHKWHGQDMPKEEQPEPRMSVSRAWSVALDHFLLFDGADCFEALTRIDLDVLRQACKKLPDACVRQLREAFVAFQDRLREAEVVPDEVGFMAGLAIEAVEELARRDLARAFRARRLATVKLQRLARRL